MPVWKKPFRRKAGTFNTFFSFNTVGLQKGELNIQIRIKAFMRLCQRELL